MYVALQPNLVERAVFEAVRNDPTLRPHYERQFADCHEHRDESRRDQAFAEMHERWFIELGLRDRILTIVREFPRIHDNVHRLMITQAPGPRTQTVELYGVPDRYSVVMAIAPRELLEHSSFEYWARHELLHIDDMLNPNFGHDPRRVPSGDTPAARTLAADRFAIIWALSIDARLNRKGMVPPEMPARRKAEFARAFAITDDQIATQTFDDLWRRSPPFEPDHVTLLQWAQFGLPGHGAVAAASQSDSPQAGAPCPLCGFPTFDWATQKAVRLALFDSIHADFPNWNPDQSICTRCEEVYSASRNAGPVCT